MKRSASWRGNFLELQPWRIRDVSPMLYLLSQSKKIIRLFYAKSSGRCIFLRHFPTRKQSGKTIGGNEQTEVYLMHYGSDSLVTGHGGCYDMSIGMPCVDGFDVTPLESIVGHIQGVTDGTSLGAIFNHFTGKFDLSPSIQTANKWQNKKKTVVLQL
ncbi:hypothetical protein Tco_1232571 [Tanacetum coccineum]